MARNQDISDFAGSDIIDVRDIIARVEELREEVATIKEEFDAIPENAGVDFGNIIRNHPDFSSELYDELQTLESLLSDLCGYGGDEQWEGDWYPVTLIHENYFETCMDDMLEDIGDIPKNLPSYLTITVDYDALKQDYTATEFEGDTYYYR